MIIQPPPQTTSKSQSKKSDELEASIEEFESLISILGDISTKAVRSKDRLNII
jgi:hypothetical protein